MLSHEPITTSMDGHARHATFQTFQLRNANLLSKSEVCVKEEDTLDALLKSTLTAELLASKLGG